MPIKDYAQKVDTNKHENYNLWICIEPEVEKKWRRITILYSH